MSSAPRGVKLDEATQKRLDALAQAKDRSPHWIMCAAIKRYLDEEERYEAEKCDDLARWKRYQLTGEAVSHQDATAWLEKLAAGQIAPCPNKVAPGSPHRS